MTSIFSLTVLVILVGGAELRSRHRMRRLQRSLTSASRLLPDLALLLALLFLALFNFKEKAPQPVGERPSIVLAVDVSTSMAAEDIRPSRIERAREEIHMLVEALPGARFALLPFAGSPVAQVPLTDDHQALLFFVDRLAPGSVNAPGSAPAEAVAAAVQLLQNESGEKAIILFSDGERTIPAAPPQISGETAVFALPIGTPQGAPVPGQVARSFQNGRKEPSMTRLDSANLRRLVEGSDGRLLTGERGAAAAAMINYWPATETTEGSSSSWPLAAAIILLLLRQLAGRGTIHRRCLEAFSISLLVLSACQIQEHSAGKEFFADGLRLAQEDTAAAASFFDRAAEHLDGDRRAAALYNRGTLLLRSGSPEKAIPFLEEALLLQPGDEAIRCNFALALRASFETPSEGLGAGDRTGDGSKEETGGDLSREEALRLVEQIRPQPFAPPALPETTIRETVPGRDW